MGQCPSCREWNTLEASEAPAEEVKRSSGHRAAQPKTLSRKLIRLSEASTSSTKRIQTAISELDRVLGGGLVRDSVSIIAAKPGAGKSTLLLQVAQAISDLGHAVLYASGEESEGQLRSRADRILGSSIQDGIYVLATANLNEVLSAVQTVRPELIIIDSIQTFYLDEFSSRPGTPTQIMECTQALVQLAKDPVRPCAVLMAGQLTKEDELAGVRSLEHMVDTVLYMEADSEEQLRTLSATKNRFGSTGEMGFFTMEETGLMPIQNPSRFFMTSRDEKDSVTGSALCVLREGSRPMIVEVESLVSQSFTPYPSRISEAVRREQLGTLISILEQRGGVSLYDKNVVVKSTGGLRLSQPSANLAVIMAIASSALQKPLPYGAVFLGDVGLTGEIKRFPSMDLCVREVLRLGFRMIFVPEASYQKGSYDASSRTAIIPVKDLKSVLSRVFGQRSSKETGDRFPGGEGRA